MKIRARVFNRYYLRFLKAQQRTQIFFGGSSSGKSFFIAQRIVLDIMQGNRNYLICRNVASTIKKSVFNEIIKAIIFFQQKEKFIINKSDLFITYIPNQQQILFCGLDDTEKIKSITPIKGVITDIFVEEATECEYQAIKQLEKRLRGQSKVKKRIILAFNPILKTHWLFNEYFQNWQDNKKVLVEDDLLIVKSTYKDNEFLTDDDRKALENEKDPYFYNVYSLGNWGILGIVIYKNWKMEYLSETKNNFDNLRIGLDFGYSSDPSALVITHYDKKNKKIYIFDEVYAVELDNEELANIIKSKIDKKPIFCDSGEPKSISELKKYGVYAIGAKKGPDSVDYGIKFLQKHEIIIDIKCQNFKNEISQYKWKEDKMGNPLPIPVDKMNHLLDALRYAYSTDMQQSEGVYFT